MNLEEALKIADTVVYAKTGKHLNDVQRVVVEGTWEGQTYDAIAESCSRSPEYLKQDVGFKLWRLLSQALGQRVSKTNFRTVMELLSEDQKAIWNGSSVPTQLHSDEAIPVVQQPSRGGMRDVAEAPDISLFYGREAELAQLQRWIVPEGCRVVALLGMGGVGKTSLAAKLVHRLESQFDSVIWRSLRQAPLLTELLGDLIQVLSGQEASPVAEELDTQISQFLDYFRDRRCLLVFDNVESLLQGRTRVGSYRLGYENYGEFFRQLGETRHSSCSILTSREKLKEIVFLEGGMLPVRSLVVRGLPERDAQELLKAKGFTESAAVWKAIVQRYAGNPLALKIVTTHIRDVFSNNAVEFLAQIEAGGAVFGDLSDFLAQQIDRLTDLERQVMDWLTVNLQPISMAQLKEDLVLPITAHELLETVESLIRRSLLELEGGKFSQPSIVLDYTLSRAIDRFVDEILSENLSLTISHAIVKAQAPDYIRYRQIEEILNPIAHKILARSSSAIELEEKLARLLEKLRGELGNPPGYAAGNLIHLCQSLHFDLTEYDFSELKIWQTYLQNTHLKNTNFTGSDLWGSVFAKPLGDSIVVALAGDRLLATADEDGKIWLWKVADGQLLRACPGQTGRVRSMAFNPQGTILASGGDDLAVYLWDVRTGECLNSGWEQTDTANCLAFSPDGDTLASGIDDGSIRLWNVNSGQCLHVLERHRGGVCSIAWSADGRTLASAGDDLTVRLWDAVAGRCRQTVDLSEFSADIHRLWTVTFVSDPTTPDRCLAAASDDRTVQLWDIAARRCFPIPLARDSISAVAFSPDGRVLGFADDRTAVIRHIDKNEVKTLYGFKSSVASIALSQAPDSQGQILVTGGLERVVQVWDASEGRRLRTLKGHKHQIDSFALSDGAGTIAIGSDNHTIELWDTVSGAVLKTLSGHRDWVCALAWSPDGRLLVSGSDDRTVKLWDVGTGVCLKTWDVRTAGTQDNVRSRIQAVAFSPDGAMVASADDLSATLWSVATGTHLHTLNGHDRRVGSIAFSADSCRLATGSYDCTVKLWDVATGDCLETLTGHCERIHTLSFSPNGNFLASGSYDRTVKLWDMATGDCLKTWVSSCDRLYDLTFRANGQLLVCSSSDDPASEHLELWDGDLGKCLHVLAQPCSPIWSADLSPDGSTLIAGYGRVIGLWDTHSGALRQTLRTDQPYQGMKIAGMTGVSAATIEALKLLGAIDDDKR